MSDTFRPMLAGKFPGNDKLQFPLYVQPKLDGIRASVVNGKLVSRTLKPIPNLYIRNRLQASAYEGLDGELIVGSPTADDCYRRTASGVMSPDGCPDFRFYVFDRWDMPGVPFRLRVRFPVMDPLLWVEIVPVHRADNLDELAEIEAAWVAEGYEGAILRGPDSLYKFGRGTAKAGDLLKLKRFTDSEAVVVGVYEEQHNGNEAVTNELGRTSRSSAQANKTGKGRLGGLVVQLLNDHAGFPAGTEFRIGTGFDARDRETLWRDAGTNLNGLNGQIAKFKHFECGAKDKPRHPVFLGFRDPIDIGDPK